VNYTYDPVGNRKQMTSTLPGVAAGLFNYDANDRFTAGDTYDANGNTIASGGIGNVYDFENHLVQKGGVTIVYDGDGNRVAKTVAGATTLYLVDTLNPTGYAQVIAEEAPNTAPLVTYVYGLERISQRRTVVINGNFTTQIRYFDYDGHGSVRGLTDPSGNVTDTYDYDAFGNLVHSTFTSVPPLGSTVAPSPNNYLYSGEQFDPDLNLYYNRARYLNVSTGRFWTMDNYEGVSLLPRSLHKYLYSSADPVNRADPSGNDDLVTTIGATLPVALIVATGLYVLAKSCVLYAEATGGQGPCGPSRDDNRQARIRIQLQLGDIYTEPNTGEISNSDPPGVTTAQARAGLLNLFYIAQSSRRFPFSQYEGDFVSAVVIISDDLKRFPPFGFSGAVKSLLSEPIGDSGWRIDLDTLEGTNFRQ